MARVMTAVTISNSNGWFDDITIPLNAGLVSIIGQKGSGKSALAELIAFAAGSWEEQEPGSFLRRAGRHLSGTTIKLEWADDTEMEVSLGQEQPDTSEVRYLSQRFVERLCADDQIGTELISEIEAVIFRRELLQLIPRLNGLKPRLPRSKGLTESGYLLPVMKCGQVTLHTSIT
jgi:hypothetical protein